MFGLYQNESKSRVFAGLVSEIRNTGVQVSLRGVI